MMRITALEHAARRTASAIIVHYHRILLGSIKMRWQIVTAAKGVATRVHEIPSLAFAQFNILQFARTQIVNQLRFQRLRIHLIESVGIGCTLTGESHFCCRRGKRETLDVLFRSLEKRKLTRFRIELEEMHAVFIFGCKIDVSIDLAPFRAQHIRIEIPGQRTNLLIRQGHQIELGVNHTRCLSFFHILSNAVESLRRSAHENALAIRRELGAVQKFALFYQGFYLWRCG